MLSLKLMVGTCSQDALDYNIFLEPCGKRGESLLGFLLSKIVLGKKYKLVLKINNLKGVVFGLAVICKEFIPNLLKYFPDV